MLLVTVVLAYATGRTIGLISLIGFEKRHRTQWGMTHREESWPRFTTPVVLVPGEALRADYRVKAPFGSLVLAARAPSEPFRPWRESAYVFVAGERAGSILFIAAEPGPHGYWAEPASINGTSSCPDGGGDLASSMGPRGSCPTLDVDYEVQWHRLSKTEAAASSLPRVIIPAEGNAFVARKL
jgi:hypothetical protein